MVLTTEFLRVVTCKVHYSYLERWYSELLQMAFHWMVIERPPADVLAYPVACL